MPYDENFYRMYLTYLEEPIVRRNHDEMFRLFARFAGTRSLRVMDLGCGTGEYARYDTRHGKYVGIDLHNPSGLKSFVRADYLLLDFAERLPLKPDAFVSLFSLECCHPAQVKYDFYERLFAEFPSLRYGMASGFFYESRRDQETVSETGEIVSYQSIEDPSQYISELFTELRIHLRTPSEMFGKDVIEVWKFFVRKHHVLKSASTQVKSVKWC